MGDLEDARTWTATHLADLLTTHGVPGAAVAVLADGATFDAAAGVVNTRTGVEATPDAVFQIGSITKVWTATLVLQLVDEGRIGLDDPVRRHLPGFRVADEAASEAITVRQLLAHTAGFEGDIFTDTGEGDDAIALLVDQLADVPQLFPPGERFSYNNAGYCVLGRLVEVLRGMPYDRCLAAHLFDPLGLTHAATGAGEAIMFRAAVGHDRPAPDAPAEPVPVWSMARSNAPAGSCLAMRAADLLAFARMHLEGGTAADGTAVLQPGTAAQMQQRQVEVPAFGVMGDGWGLGWELFDTDGGVIVGHDGTTLGQHAFLRMVPERGVAVALLTNGGDVMALARDVIGPLLADLAGTALPPSPVPPAAPVPVDAHRVVGTYSADVADLVVSQDDAGRVWLEQIPKGALADMGHRPERKELVGYADDALIPLEPEGGVHIPHHFVGDDGQGRALYLHIGRALRRADA